jgi:hypothetical protein
MLGMQGSLLWGVGEEIPGVYMLFASSLLPESKGVTRSIEPSGPKDSICTVSLQFKVPRL